MEKAPGNWLFKVLQSSMKILFGRAAGLLVLGGLEGVNTGGPAVTRSASGFDVGGKAGCLVS